MRSGDEGTRGVERKVLLPLSVLLPSSHILGKNITMHVPEYISRFMRDLLPNLLSVDPPKTEPSTQLELKIENPHVPPELKTDKLSVQMAQRHHEQRLAAFKAKCGNRVKVGSIELR